MNKIEMFYSDEKDGFVSLAIRIAFVGLFILGVKLADDLVIARNDLVLVASQPTHIVKEHRGQGDEILYHPIVIERLQAR